VGDLELTWNWSHIPGDSSFPYWREGEDVGDLEFVLSSRHVSLQALYRSLLLAHLALHAANPIGKGAQLGTLQSI
jgi:hypothetical protein